MQINYAKEKIDIILKLYLFFLFKSIILIAKIEIFVYNLCEVKI